MILSSLWVEPHGQTSVKELWVSFLVVKKPSSMHSFEAFVSAGITCHGIPSKWFWSYKSQSMTHHRKSSSYTDLRRVCMTHPLPTDLESVHVCDSANFSQSMCMSDFSSFYVTALVQYIFVLLLHKLV